MKITDNIPFFFRYIHLPISQAFIIKRKRCPRNQALNYSFEHAGNQYHEY